MHCSHDLHNRVCTPACVHQCGLTVISDGLVDAGNGGRLRGALESKTV